MKKTFIYISAILLLGWSSHAGAVNTDALGGVDIHGFISQGLLISDTYNYLTHDSTDGSFQYNEMGINFSKQLTDKLRLGVQFFARDLGNVANNKVTIDWAYADYRWRDWLGIRAGKIKNPVPLYSETRDMDMLRNSIVMPQSLYPELLRDTVIALNGLGLYGYVPMGSGGSLDYMGLIGQISIDNDSGAAKYANSSFGGFAVLEGEVDTDIAVSGRLRWHTPLPGLMLSVSAFQTSSEYTLSTMLGSSMTMATENTVLLGGAEYTWENLVLAGEYQNNKTDRTTSMTGDTVTTTKSEAWYLSAAYRFTDWFELGTYYSVTYPDKDDRDGDNKVASGQPDHQAWQKDLVLSLRFDINANWVAKIEGHVVDGTADVLAVDNPDRSEQDWYYGAAKVSFSF